MLKVLYTWLTFMCWKLLWNSTKVVTILPYLRILRTSIITGEWRNAHWYNNGINAMAVTNHFLISFKVHSKKWNSYLSPLSVNKPILRQKIYNKRKSITFIVLSKQHINQTLNNLLYLHIHAPINSYQRNFCL